MNNCVIYARFSSRGQNEQSIETQVNICTELAQKNGYNVINVYSDKARTGTNDARPAFQRMIKDAESGAFQYVIVYMFDRFARNRRDSIIYKEMLKEKYGIRVLSALEPIADDEGGEFYEMFLEWNAEKYSKRLSKRVKDGLDSSVANGTYCGGVLIYGYEIVLEDVPGKPGKYMKRVHIKEDEANIIKYVYEQYNLGIKKKDILRDITEQGLRYRDGNPFIMHQLDNWLVNPKYTGRFVFGGRDCDNMYPPIISQELFDSVQKRLAQNRYGRCGRDEGTVEFLLTGKVFCAKCGAKLVGTGGTGHCGIKYQYYTCQNTLKKKCPKMRENKTALEQAVTEYIVKYFRDPKRLEKAVDDSFTYYEQRTDSTVIKSLETRMANIRKDVDEMANAFIKAKSKMLQESIEKKMADYELYYEDLQKQHDQLLLERGHQISREEMEKFIITLLSGDTTDTSYQKSIIGHLVHKIYVDDNGFTAFTNLHASNDDNSPDFEEFVDKSLIQNEVCINLPLSRQVKPKSNP